MLNAWTGLLQLLHIITGTNLGNTFKSNVEEDNSENDENKYQESSLLSAQNSATSSVLPTTVAKLSLGSGDSKLSKHSILDSSEFLGKGDITAIKAEFKNDKNEEKEKSEEQKLSETLVKITVTDLLRPNIPRPKYVPSPDPANLGKPVKNYKKFKKQLRERGNGSSVSLVKYVEGELNQSKSITDWINQNQDVTRREEEEQQLEKQAEDMWVSQTSQTPTKSRRNQFSRK